MHWFLVSGNSMEPWLHPGDVVVTRRVRGQPKRGDIVVYRHPVAGFHVVHRVHAASPLDLLAGGDANGTTDPHPVQLDCVVGRVWGRFPRLGRLVCWLRGAQRDDFSL